MSENLRWPQFRVAEMPSIGAPLMEIKADYEQRKPGPVLVPERDLHHILVMIYENNQLLREIQERVNTPWYRRFWDWLRRIG